MTTKRETARAAAPVGRLLDIRNVCLSTSLSRKQIYNMARDGTFPAPLQLTTRRVAWRAKDVEEWIASRPWVSWAA